MKPLLTEWQVPAITRLAASLAAGAIALIAAGCGSGSTPTALQTVSTQKRPTASAFQHLYVANADSVTVYSQESVAPIRTISKVSPTAIAVDSDGELYVGSVPPGLNGVIRVYAAQSENIVRSITHQPMQPVAMKFDKARRLYAGDVYGGVLIFKVNSGTVQRILPEFYAQALAFDSAGNLFAGNSPGPYGQGSTSVDVYSANAKSPSRVILDGIGLPVALAIDSSDNLYVANENLNTITVYAPGSSQVLRTISRGLRSPVSIAFDGAGDLYVANENASTVTVYAPGGAIPLRTIRDGISHPKALVVATNGTLYVANRSNITEYSTSATTASRTITKGIDAPFALALGP